MSVLTAAWHALDVARTEARALDAAIATGKAGGSPLAVVRAFADASGGKLEAWALEELEAGLRAAIVALHGLSGIAAVVVKNAPAVVMGVEKATDQAINVGYAAASLRVTLETWLSE